VLLAFLQGLALGLSLAGPPGPVNALIARESARHGPLAGLRAGLPAPIVDTAYLVLVLAGLAAFSNLEAFLPWLAGIGAVLLAFLAWSTVQLRGQARELAGPWSVWAVTLTNPFQYAWWISAGTSFIATQGPWGVAGFLCAIFGWVGIFSFLVHQGATRWTWFSPLLEIASADLLLLFALRLGLTAAAGL